MVQREARWLWTSGLRPAASPGMTEYQQNDIEDDMH